MKRVPDTGDNGSDSGDEESASSDNETMALVKAHKKERKDAKQRKRGGGDGAAGSDGEREEAGEGNLFIFDKRSDVDGSRRVTGVDGEEEMEDDVEADLGMKVEPFHLREEMATGHFTEEGHYVERNFGSTRDAWLDEMDEEEQARKPRTAADRKKKVVRVAPAAGAAGAGAPDRATSAAELAAMIKELHDLLQDSNETVTGALSRLARDKRAANEKRRTEARKKHAATVVDDATREFKKPIAHVPSGGGGEAEEPFDRVTVLADRLLHEGTHTVYEMRRSDLMVRTKKRNIIAAKKRTAKIWYYIIRGGGGGEGGGGDSEVFGPFSTDQMLEWSDFLSQQPNVDVKLSIGKQRQWRPFKSVNLEQEIADLN